MLDKILLFGIFLYSSITDKFYLIKASMHHILLLSHFFLEVNLEYPLVFSLVYIINIYK